MSVAANGVSSTFTTRAFPSSITVPLAGTQFVEGSLAVVTLGRSCALLTGMVTCDDTQPVGVWVVVAVYAVGPPFNCVY